MCKTEQLNKLFEEWKKEQKKETDSNIQKGTIPVLKVSKDSLT